MFIKENYEVEVDTVFTIGEFSIFWCQFEQVVFDAEANTIKILSWAETFEDSIIDRGELTLLCANIRKYATKYLKNTEMATIQERVYSLKNQGNSTHQKLIYEFLNNSSSEIHFLGCMLYIQRIRNNLFHGLKGIFTLNSQKEMFDSINRLFEYLLKAV
ncbi:MAG: hypothetical protein ACYDEX_13875 [Mobilitalea sp.]